MSSHEDLIRVGIGNGRLERSARSVGRIHWGHRSIVERSKGRRERLIVFLGSHDGLYDPDDGGGGSGPR